MRRGFKAECERRALAARETLGLGPTDKLCPWDYAKTVGAHVVGADELDLPPAHKAQLLVHDSSSWSGMTLVEDGILLVVINSAHSKARQAATLMHELAHSILGHQPSSAHVSDAGLVLLSDYSDEQEEEADWLSAVLLLPEPALIFHRGEGRSAHEIASLFGVSLDLANWRCRMSGVEKRLAFRARR